MKIPTYSVIFNYNFDLPQNNQFIIKNIQYFLKVSKIYINFYIHAISDKKINFDQKLFDLKNEIKSKCNCEIKILLSDEEKKYVIENNYRKKYKIISCDYDSLFSYFFFNNLHDFFSYTKNISLPVMHYKYSFVDYQYKQKNIKIKKFISSSDPFYQSSNSIPDWDERLYLDFQLFQKLEGKLPIMCPSPLLHNWGKYKTTISCEEGEENIKIFDSKFSIHKFENITSEK